MSIRVFLTSTGISTERLKKDLFKFLPTTPSNLNALFITTASNPFMEDKSWLIDEINSLYKLQFKNFFMRDIASATKAVVLQEINNSDVLIFGGGEEFYLLDKLREHFADNELKELFSKKLYIGISAGSMILAPILSVEVSHKIYKESLDRKDSVSGLGLINFYIIPHLYAKWDNLAITPDAINSIKNAVKLPIYAIDDNTALIVQDNKISVVGDKRFYKV